MNIKEFKSIRISSGLTQTELAALLKDRTGTGSRALVAKIEAGSQPIKKYIAEAMMRISIG